MSFADMEASSYQAGKVGVTYTFNFKCSDDIPNGGDI